MRNRVCGLFAAVALATGVFAAATTAAYADNVAPSIVSASSTAFTVGSLTDTFTVQANGDPTPTISESGALPSSLEFIDNGDGTATLDGTADPGTAGSYPLTITATNGVAPDATQDFLLTVNPQQNSITSGSVATFVEGLYNVFIVQATGDPTPNGISESGALPSGVSFTDNGNGTATLQGPADPGTAGTYPLTITATNGVVADATQNFVLTVIPLPPAVNGECSGIQFLGTFTPPLLGSGTAVSTVARLKTAKAGLVVWGPGFGGSITTTGQGSCTIGGSTFNDVSVGAQLSGVASCDTTSTDPTLYPLNGKLKLSYAAKTFSTQTYIRVAGFDPVPGPDVIALTGIVTKGIGVGATIGGEVFFDPVFKALVNGEAGGPELEGQYYFDNSQIVAPCGTPGGGSIGLIYGGDGTSLLGSSAPGLTLTFTP